MSGSGSLGLSETGRKKGAGENREEQRMANQNIKK